jgi:hypothetical protein
MAHDHDQIAAAAQHLPKEVVAERIGCSVRTVERVIRTYDVDTSHTLPKEDCGTAWEWRRWRFSKRMDGVSDTAYRYARSRQAIYDGLQRLGQRDKVGGIPKTKPDHQTA